MHKRVAVMDLGTNTFHLLITEGNIEQFKTLRHDSIAVKLGEGGINKGLIQPEAFERGIEAMKGFQQYIDYFEVTEVKAIATSALRNASNGNDFIREVKVQTGITIEVINGDTEASYIYYGVKAAGVLSAGKSLIVDIGGGSVEFIIADQSRIFWKQSFEIGAARLMDQFHQADPIPEKSIEALYRYLDEKLEPLFAVVDKYLIKNLIGSSGAFETFAELSETQKGNRFDLKIIKNYRFETTDLCGLMDKLIRSSHQERANNTHIIPVRVDMIVVTSVLTGYLINKLNVNEVQMCTYSLKEGVLAELLS